MIFFSAATLVFLYLKHQFYRKILKITAMATVDSIAEQFEELGLEPTPEILAKSKFLQF